MNPLEVPLIAHLRRSHALEHATLHLLAQHNPHLRLIGRTMPEGFYLYGRVETEEVATAAKEALARLRAGERDLAIHPQCGTNLAVTGILAGLFSFAAMWGRKKPRLAKLPGVLLAATAATILAKPLGPIIQERITTSAEVEEMTIEKVTRLGKGVHWVRLGLKS
ncbi:MAG: DUF6391 domain-containing protein [Chloroflexota bacterium]|nr:DUF6391 domain-containing protein [Chloroflexota bacterium]